MARLLALSALLVVALDLTDTWGKTPGDTTKIRICLAFGPKGGCTQWSRILSFDHRKIHIVPRIPKDP